MVRTLGKGFKAGWSSSSNMERLEPDRFWNGRVLNATSSSLDRVVQLGQAMKRTIAEPRQDPTFHHLHCGLDHRLVLRFAFAGRNDGQVVVPCELQDRLVDVRLVLCGLRTPDFTLSAAMISGQPEKNSSIRTCDDTQSSRPCVHVASTTVYWLAPSAPTKTCASRMTPVLGSVTGTVCPA